MGVNHLLPILFVSVMLVAFAAGCGPPNDNGGSGKSESNKSGPEAQDPGQIAADAAASEALGYIHSSKAGQHMGKDITVRGLVKDYQWISGKPGRPTLLLFDVAALVERGSSISDQEIPETFTVVVWKEDTRKWPPAPSFGAVFNKKMVCATGTVEEFNGNPAIIATEPAQLVIDC